MTKFQKFMTALEEAGLTPAQMDKVVEALIAYSNDLLQENLEVLDNVRAAKVAKNG